MLARQWDGEHPQAYRAQPSQSVASHANSAGQYHRQPQRSYASKGYRLKGQANQSVIFAALKCIETRSSDVMVNALEVGAMTLGRPSLLRPKSLMHTKVGGRAGGGRVIMQPNGNEMHS